MLVEEQRIQKQYKSPGLFEEITQRLKSQSLDMKNIKRADIAGVDEFHVRGAQVSKELATSMNLEGLKILDVGCGLGGPVRMLADDYGCSVIGIDMSADYIRTAIKLSKLVGLSGLTDYHQGDALALPFEDCSFDIVWTQHVQMNIDNKQQFYSEIQRVLAPMGKLMYYDIFKTGEKDVQYPVPWANDKSVSFLGTSANMKNMLNHLGFTEVETKDQTQLALKFLQSLFAKIKADGPPKIGLNVLMGDATKDKLGNILKGIEEDVIQLESGMFSL